jgi:DNA-directed RNA polymerase subunit E'/Rpb7
MTECKICLHVRIPPHSLKRPLKQVLSEELTTLLRLKTIRDVGRTGGSPVLESDILDYSDATVAVNDGAAFVTTVVKTSAWRPELGSIYDQQIKVIAAEEGRLRVLLPRSVALSKDEERAIREAARIPDHSRASLLLENHPDASTLGSEVALSLFAAKSSDEKADQHAIAMAFAASLQTYEVIIPAQTLPKGSYYDKANQSWRIFAKSTRRGHSDEFEVVRSGSFLPFSLQIDSVDFVQVAGSARTGAANELYNTVGVSQLGVRGKGENSSQISSAAAAMAPFRAGMSPPNNTSKANKQSDATLIDSSTSKSMSSSILREDDKSGQKRVRCGGDFTLQRICADAAKSSPTGTAHIANSTVASDGAHLSWPPTISLPNHPWLFPPNIGALSYNAGLGFGLSRLQGRVVQKKNDLFSKGGGKNDSKKPKVLVPSSPQPSASINMVVNASIVIK